ncbi:uncharacterized protein Z518_09818 [Rhinocladiella mackenziei CBS 650.93]|uniref:Uncharacterized protein n=1 Tax=Rhinocladiella mackenziei CBS 650.93 TaxID=1442369 RepID=A0A0D2GR06_9EURO|nr:uncharacterized protein Z518_09818 [Rhinocladiella mackenziei CBS 650.93]KIX00753.1 hypothetical protein Z518_09818 [Rhinocladiella mackenziei CBS 650.93]
MKRLAQFLMRYAAEVGFRGIRIDCIQDAVTKVWSQPPPPVKSTPISEFHTSDLYEDEQVNGSTRKVKPFGEAKQRITRIFVDLKPSANGHITAETSLPTVATALE